MKVSEALLFCIEAQGGEIPFTQFQAWVGQLTKAGYLEFEKRGEGAGVSFHYLLTEKGREYLRKAGL